MTLSIDLDRRRSFAFVTVVLAAIAAPTSARAFQETVTEVPATVPFGIPAQVADLTLGESAQVGGAMAFSYRGRNITKLDVFIYPLPAADTSRSDVRDVLVGQVESFKESLPIGLSRGWYDDYRLAFDTEKPVRAGEKLVPGYAVSMVFTQGGSKHASFLYVYALRGMLVKIRLTVPEAGWDANPALDFPTQFIEQIASAR